MKKTKIIIPALGLLLLSTAASVTGTVAWFAMNDTVTASGMQVKARAEDGILIKNELDGDSAANWKASTNASYGSLVELAPTSTANFTAWYHNKSDSQTDAKAGQLASTYETLSSNANWKRDEGSGKSGAYYIDTNADNTKATAEKAYVILNKFYIKSSGDAITFATSSYTDLYVTKLEVTGASGSADLDASLRVGIKVGSTILIYAPVSGATAEYKAGGSDSGTTVNALTAVPAAGTALSATSIPAVTAPSGWVEADVYIYFEGEDANLKSENLTNSLDTLEVEIDFSIK